MGVGKITIGIPLGSLYKYAIRTPQDRILIMKAIPLGSLYNYAIRTPPRPYSNYEGPYSTPLLGSVLHGRLWRGHNRFSSHQSSLGQTATIEAMWPLLLVLQLPLTRVASQDQGIFSLHSAVQRVPASCLMVHNWHSSRIPERGYRLNLEVNTNCETEQDVRMFFYWNQTWLVSWYYQKCVDFFADPSLTYPHHGRPLVLSDCEPGQQTMDWVWQDGRIRHAHAPFCADLPGVNSTSFSGKTPVQLGTDCGEQGDQVFLAVPTGNSRDWFQHREDHRGRLQPSPSDGGRDLAATRTLGRDFGAFSPCWLEVGV